MLLSNYDDCVFRNSYFLCDTAFFSFGKEIIPIKIHTHFYNVQQVPQQDDNTRDLERKNPFIQRYGY